MDGSTRAMVPIIQIFAFYVIFHGHYSPGGGFQGGALLAGSVLLQRVVLGKASRLSFRRRLGTPFGIAGLSVYVGVGLLALAFGGRFLDHGAIPSGLDAAALRGFGILAVEIGIGLAVMGTLVSIFDDLSEVGEDEA
jgi:multicomponent Na+:H+ antiporter subunit B